MGLDLLPANILRDFDVAERYHACSILRTDFPEEWNDLTNRAFQPEAAEEPDPCARRTEESNKPWHRPVLLWAGVA